MINDAGYERKQTEKPRVLDLEEEKNNAKVDIARVKTCEIYRG